MEENDLFKWILSYRAQTVTQRMREARSNEVLVTYRTTIKVITDIKFGEFIISAVHPIKLYGVVIDSTAVTCL